MKTTGARVLVCALSVLAPLMTATSPAGAATGCGPADRLAGAQTYVDALADPSVAYDVPVAPNVVRFENGLQTGFSGDFMRAELAAHLQYGGITDISNQRWSGTGNLVRAIYDLDYGVGDLNIADATIDETFAFNSACEIQRIDATFSVRPGSSLTGDEE